MISLDVVLNRNFTNLTKEYKKFAIEKSNCKQCSIFDCYKQVGQSEGNVNNPTFMFVGESLGKDESEQVRPFIGKAGQRLRQELRKHQNFTKQTTIISNILSCRPKDNVFPKDQNGPFYLHLKDGPTEVSAEKIVKTCTESWLFREIKLLKPKVIVTLGSVPLKYIRKETGITDKRGSWKFLPEFRAWSIATYHPSYVLRCENDKSKQFVAEQFEKDIEQISSKTFAIVNGDKRMSFSDPEWQDYLALVKAFDLGIIKENPNTD